MSLIFLDLVLAERKTEPSKFGIVSVSFLSAYFQRFFAYLSSTYCKTANDSLGLIIGRSPVQVRVGPPFLLRFNHLSRSDPPIYGFGSLCICLKKPVLLFCARHFAIAAIHCPKRYRNLVPTLLLFDLGQVNPINLILKYNSSHSIRFTGQFLVEHRKIYK